MSDKDTRQINIEQGTYIEGQVNTGGGDFVGRDLTINNYYGASAESKAEEIPHQPFEPDMVDIPAGPFIMGSADGPAYEGPPHEIHLPAYGIGKYPVTNEQFAAFIEASGKVVPSLGWPGQKPTEAQKKLPVTGVTWYLALEYCHWLSEQTGRPYTLPTEAEWEKAARGPDGRRYPWGDDWEEDRCNPDPTRITPVAAFVAQNEFGCYDLVGNIREWTCSLWGSKRRRPAPEFAYRQTAEQGRQDWATHSPRHNLEAGSQTRRVYRGGASPNPAHLYCARRQANMPDTKVDLDRHGLRVVIRLEDS